MPRRPPRAGRPGWQRGRGWHFHRVYPRTSPAGWQVIGQTDAKLRDTGRDPPALLAPGTIVRFLPA